MKNNIIFFFVCILLIVSRCNSTYMNEISPLPTYEDSYVITDSLNIDSISYVNYAFISEPSIEKAPAASEATLYFCQHPTFSPVVKPSYLVWTSSLFPKG